MTAEILIADDHALFRKGFGLLLHRPNSGGYLAGRNRIAEMAIAQNTVQLPIGQVEEPRRLAEGVVLEPGASQNRFIERNRQWRIILTQA